MKKLLLLFVTVLLFSGCLTIPDPMDSSIPENTVYDGDVYVALKFQSETDLEAYFSQFDLVPAQILESKGYHGMASELIKLSGLFEDTEYIYSSWQDYTIIQLPKGRYLLNSSHYPPALTMRGITFHYQDDIILEIDGQDPFVYGGEIVIHFIDDNEFGQKDYMVEIKDGYKDSLDQLSQWLKDEEGNYMVPVNKTITAEPSHFYMNGN